MTTITEKVVYQFPAEKSVREELAVKLGFSSIKTLKASGSEAIKQYAKDVAALRESVEVSVTYPNVTACKAEDLQKLVAGTAKYQGRVESLLARSKGEPVSTVIVFTLIDLIGETALEDITDEDYEAVEEYLRAYCKFFNYPELTIAFVYTAVFGARSKIAPLHTVFNKVREFFAKFAAYVASNFPQADLQTLQRILEKRDNLLKKIETSIPESNSIVI